MFTTLSFTRDGKALNGGRGDQAGRMSAQAKGNGDVAWALIVSKTPARKHIARECERYPCAHTHWGKSQAPPGFSWQQRTL